MQVPTMSDTQDTLIEFPCRFPLKIMGQNVPEFAPTIVEVVRVHAPDFDAEVDLVTRQSTGGKWTSITVTITATSKPQLDSLYLALTGHPLVKVVF